MILFYVRAVRQNMVRHAARVNDLIGPFNTYSEASRYATAWRALWIEQQGKAVVEMPISPCPDTLEWYQDKVERDAETARREARALARREARADDMFASEARVSFANTAQWEASSDVLNRIAKTAF